MSVLSHCRLTVNSSLKDWLVLEWLHSQNMSTGMAVVASHSWDSRVALSDSQTSSVSFISAWESAHCLTNWSAHCHGNCLTNWSVQLTITMTHQRLVLIPSPSWSHLWDHNQLFQLALVCHLKFAAFSWESIRHNYHSLKHHIAHWQTCQSQHNHNYYTCIVNTLVHLFLLVHMA